ncbi:hypothetical protein GR294_22620 [Raoultella sp. Lac2]|uniref:hypothetical protein n=1 Tax=unclassified Raoultella TaxID=2627600 RepID=UPI001354F426|nr:hypothetical protein [Raoultella sp. Lac2]MXF98851.1 hypothetical protein [Raoultella sp. Lac1]
MSFKLSATKTVQIHYLGGYLCDKDVEIDLIYTVEIVRQDISGLALRSVKIAMARLKSWLEIIR